jgi:hypothetical protein
MGNLENAIGNVREAEENYVQSQVLWEDTAPFHIALTGCLYKLAILAGNAGNYDLALLVFCFLNPLLSNLYDMLGSILAKASRLPDLKNRREMRLVFSGSRHGCMRCRRICPSRWDRFYWQGSCERIFMVKETGP